MTSVKNNKPKSKNSGQEMLLYGVHACLAAIKNPQRKILKLWATLNIAQRYGDVFEGVKLSPQMVTPADLGKKLGKDAVHQGIALLTHPLALVELEDILPTQGNILVLDQVQDPHNVGAILRSAAAFGIKAVITTKRHAPAPSGLLAKAASGALEHVSYIQVTNLARALETTQRAGYQTIGLDSEAEHKLENIGNGLPFALVLGAEGKGLRRLSANHCDYLARLDLPGSLTCLNVSNAAALGLYIMNRQVEKGV